jgi:hypothetical protein
LPEYFKQWLFTAKVSQLVLIFTTEIIFVSRFSGREHTHTTPQTVLERLNSKNEILQKMENIFTHIFWSKNHVLKKVGRGRDLNWFIWLVFWNLHALGSKGRFDGNTLFWLKSNYQVLQLPCQSGEGTETEIRTTFLF